MFFSLLFIENKRNESRKRSIMFLRISSLFRDRWWLWLYVCVLYAWSWFNRILAYVWRLWMFITFVVNEIYELYVTWTHDLNVLSWWCPCDCDYGVMLRIGFPRSSTTIWSCFHAPKNYLFELPCLANLTVWIWVLWEDQWCDDKIWNVLLILRVDNVVCVDIYAWDYNFVYVVFVASLCCT